MLCFLVVSNNFGVGGVTRRTSKNLHHGERGSKNITVVKIVPLLRLFEIEVLFA